MKKFLYIDNSTRPCASEMDSLEEVRLDNCSLPCVEAAIAMDYRVYMGVNRTYAGRLTSGYGIQFYNANIFRSVTDIKNNIIAYKNLLALLKRERIDVIHCNTPIGGVLGRICGNKARVGKIIYTVHGFHFYGGAPLINNTLYKWVEMWLARYTDAIITMNREDYAAALKLRLRNNGRVYYIPGVGIDTSRFREYAPGRKNTRGCLGLKEDDIMLIAAGDLVRRKNYEASIKSIAQAGNPRLHFYICGTGPRLTELEKLAHKLNIQDQVHFLGHRGDVAGLLKAADIFLFTSFQEGLPRSLMEAMASGLPCVASRIRGNTDLLAENAGGFLCAPNDIAGFCRAIRTLAEDADLRKEMGLANKKRVQDFDIDKVRARIAEIYGQELA